MRKKMNPRFDRKHFSRDAQRGKKDILFKGLVRGGKRI